MNLNIESLLYSLPAILIALAFHEFSHGLVATILGDPTPKAQGRLSLNPLRHLDPMGTLMMVITSFGWAKPVMVNPLHFRGSRKMGMLWVSLAGPVSNVLLAMVAGLGINLINSGLIPYNGYFNEFFWSLFYVNISLAAFNIIPLPPLDGSKVAAALLPGKYAELIYSAGQYALIIIILLSVSGILRLILNPIIILLIKFVATITGINYL